jgi:dTDP-4-dehydrorhamnose reductase
VSERRRILVFGGSGQIGGEVVRTFSSWADVAAPARADADLASAASIREILRSLKPAVVVNAAAYTDVDGAESQAEECARINAAAPVLMAEECRALGAVFVHFSTDYVFDGEKRTPYVETDATNPLGAYARSKRDGEDGVASVGGAFLIFRTAWIYGPRGRNFPSTILRLARERDELAVVDDQRGAPTSAAAVASGVSRVLRSLANESDARGALEDAAGIYHLTAAGETTWFDFARRVLADDPRVAEQMCRTVRPVSSRAYSRPAARPAYSVLDNTKIAARFGVQLPSWEAQWRATVDDRSRR